MQKEINTGIQGEVTSVKEFKAKEGEKIYVAGEVGFFGGSFPFFFEKKPEQIEVTVGMQIPEIRVRLSVGKVGKNTKIMGELVLDL